MHKNKYWGNSGFLKNQNKNGFPAVPYNKILIRLTVGLKQVNK